MAAVKDTLAGLWKLAKMVEVQGKHSQALERLASQVGELERLLIRLDEKVERVIVEAKGAAAAEAAAACHAAVGTLALRVGELGGRIATITEVSTVLVEHTPAPKRLPAPKKKPARKTAAKRTTKGKSKPA